MRNEMGGKKNTVFLFGYLSRLETMEALDLPESGCSKCRGQERASSVLHKVKIGQKLLGGRFSLPVGRAKQSLFRPRGRLAGKKRRV